MSLETLYYVLAGGFIVMVFFISFAAIRLIRTLKILEDLLLKADDITGDVQNIKNTVKIGAFAMLIRFINLFRRKL